jgi:hypothetical protein
MRALNLKATSAYSIRIVRRHAERLELDTSHFRAGRITILLRTYRKYIVGNARGLLGDVDARSAEVRASA